MGYEEDVIAAEQEAIKLKSKSKIEKQERYDRRKWGRAGQDAKEEFEHRYDEPQRKPVKVTRQEPERIEPKSVKIQRKGMDESKARYAQRQADRIMREAKESGKEATRKLAQKITRKNQERVEDEEVVEKVDKALKSKKYHPPAVKTRSQELREIRDKAYDKQRGVEDKKKIQKENKAAERSGRRAGMGFVDRNVDKVVEAREKVEGVGERIEEIREKVAPGSTKAKPQKSKATVKPVKLSAAQKRRLDQQMARSQKALAPKARSPFGTRTKTLKGPTTQKSTGSLNRPNTGGLNAPNKPSFGSSKSGNPFGSSRKGNPFSTQKSGNPLGGKRHTGNPFGATGARNPNPIGWSQKRITRL